MVLWFLFIRSSCFWSNGLHTLFRCIHYSNTPTVHQTARSCSEDGGGGGGGAVPKSRAVLTSAPSANISDYSKARYFHLIVVIFCAFFIIFDLKQEKSAENTDKSVLTSFCYFVVQILSLRLYENEPWLQCWNRS